VLMGGGDRLGRGVVGIRRIRGLKGVSGGERGPGASWKKGWEKLATAVRW
jgi:hypothetical protein